MRDQRPFCTALPYRLTIFLGLQLALLSLLHAQLRATEPQPTPAPAAETKEANSQEVIRELDGFLGKIFQDKDAEPHRFQQLEVDHARARAEYAELLKLIPRDEQLQFPGLDKQTNAFPAIKAAREKFVKLNDIYEETDAAETQEYVDYLLGEAAETNVPWERDEDAKEVKRWLHRNQSYTLAITSAINDAGYCSPLLIPGLAYDERLDDFDVETNRECLDFLTQRLHYHCRQKDWPAAVAEFELMARYAELINKAPGYLADYMFTRAYIMMVCRAAERLVRQPEFPAVQIPKLLDRLQRLQKAHGSLAACIEFESQHYMLNKLAQIPLLPDVRDQIPALHLLCYRARPPRGQKLAEEKEDKKILVELMGYYCLLQERAAPALVDHQRPFDKAETAKLHWAWAKATAAELRRHEFPHATAKLDDAASPELELLNHDGAKKFAILFPSQSSRTPLPPLSDERIKELRARFQKQTNPLGRLYLSETNLTADRDRMLLAPASEEWLAVTIIKLACQLYELNLKHRPQVLDDLVKQGYLAAVPLNHYTGEPFGYDPVRGQFWRTGKQGTTNGLKPPLKPDEFDLGESGYGIHRLISEPEEEVE